MSYSWILLLVAGLLEVAWAVGLKYTNGFTRFLPSLWVGASILASLYLLSLAQRELPIAVAYAVWMGIGTLGTALVTSFVLHQPLSLLQWVFVSTLLASVIGLKITA
jgi:quaternary ammonium compound-resistance protein SugE